MSSTIPSRSTIESLTSELLELAGELHVDVTTLNLRSIVNIRNLKIRYNELSTMCKDNALVHPDWNILSGRVYMRYLNISTPKTFSQATRLLEKKLDKEYYAFVMDYSNSLDAFIVPSRDMSFDIFAVKTLLNGYLLSNIVQGEKITYETPQYMYLRVATYLYFSRDSPEESLDLIKKAYDDMSNGLYTHATPTLFNSGMVRHQLASCFTIRTEDTLAGPNGIIDSWAKCAEISKMSGGIGIDITPLRTSEISGEGESGGIMRWIKAYESILGAVDQGSKRKGSATLYYADWHSNIEDVIGIRKKDGDEHMRARGLTHGVWVSDLFMKRVEEDKEWTLFCPNKVTNLYELYGDDFEKEYLVHEAKHISGEMTFSRTVKARDLFNTMLLVSIETGCPFILFKDAVNRKSNQMNIGTITLSNLCTEILLVTNKLNIGSCILASAVLAKCVRENQSICAYGKNIFDFEILEGIIRSLVRNLNQVIDRNYYPDSIPLIKETNLRTRPLGIGVQSLANVFVNLDMAFTSPEARQLNREIFECIYYSAISESMELAKIHGAYADFQGSPLSKGQFQFDLWDEDSKSLPIDTSDNAYVPTRMFSGRYDWDSLREQVITYGVRNSLLVALMPTATSAHILGNNESFEPFTQLIYNRTTGGGQFTLVNRQLVKDLEQLKLWTTPVIQNILSNGGSLSNIKSVLPNEIPYENNKRVDFLIEKYKTVFELSQMDLLDMSLDRGRFVCQTQSFVVHLENPTVSKLNSYMFRAWKGGAKTASYYIRTVMNNRPTNYSISSVESPMTIGSPIPPSTPVRSVEGYQPPTPSRTRKIVECTDEICVMCQS